ncbi:MCE family protein [Candidatus Mycobacterium wuenschmannii]|uniref:MCE family protein n=1 Tax=Candidatus Mycobacterium wuenschmannii TaxID=3027808 RepID=A0ABY8W0Y4_9MYCO|nr:MCE family protein [Candidatus Mycobacterium wuenschmannii]WIM88073.1 MCE family protein [Candidatus Mycobacterium wuenschmannii]
MRSRRPTIVRLAAAAMAAAIAAVTAITYLAYTSAFTPTDTVTVDAARAGLVMERDAKVKYLGVHVGRVAAIAYDQGRARLTLAIRRDQMGYIPANAAVRIAGNTVFGAKSVEFLAPEHPSTDTLAPGSRIAASSVAVEVNTLFQTLVDTLHKIDPTELNATLTAAGQGLRDNGNNLGAAMADLDTYLSTINPKLPALQRVTQKTAAVADIYASAAPHLVTVVDNIPALSNTVVSQRDNLKATLLSAIGLADNGYLTLQPAADDYIATINRLRAPLKVLGDYSPEYGCLVTALSSANQKFGPYLGGYVPGISLTANFMLGQPAYTYPESLPIVNASGGPNCRGLPDLPSKQYGGSWFHSPFLVTDNAYVPYQPNTELSIDAPSTLQFLFHGAYAERDDY